MAAALLLAVASGCSEGPSEVTSLTAPDERSLSTTSAEAPAPNRVSDLSVELAGTSSVTLSWTQVDDGTEAPADYDLRYAPAPLGWGWGSATHSLTGECANPIEGTGAGSEISCTVTGLPNAADYDFQLVAFREEADGRIYGELSNVAGAPANAPVLSQSGLSANEPSGFETFTSRRFQDLREHGWGADVDNPNLSIVSDPSARSGSTVGEIRYRAGSTGGRTPAWTENWSLRDEGFTRLYLSFRVKLSSNWQGHPSGVNKIGFVWTHQKPVAFPVFRGAGSAAMKGVVYLQDIPGGGRRLDGNLAEPELPRGEWHDWEVVLVSNTGSSANGEVHWWINGEKVGEYTDIRFGNADQSKIWETVAWRPIWGGIHGRVGQDMYMRMDDFYVSGRR